MPDLGNITAWSKFLMITLTTNLVAFKWVRNLFYYLVVPLFKPG